MRYIASSLLLAWTTVGAPLAVSAVSTPVTNPDMAFGVREETPNQRRIRLGQPIVASYPPPDYGELIETPNHRRKRLGLPMPTENDPGVAEETPNHRRAHLQTAAAQQ